MQINAYQREEAESNVGMRSKHESAKNWTLDSYDSIDYDNHIVANMSHLVGAQVFILLDRPCLVYSYVCLQSIYSTYYMIFQHAISYYYICYS